MISDLCDLTRLRLINIPNVALNITRRGVGGGGGGGGSKMKTEGGGEGGGSKNVPGSSKYIHAYLSSRVSDSVFNKGYS